MTLTVARPRWLGDESPIFSCLHRPSGAVREVGVVLCPPFGYEMLCSHRAVRRLAASLASAGFAALRIDYHGTGDSSGGDLEPDRMAAWVASIGTAVRAMQDTGIRRVALVGVRFGALLAAEYAKRSPVDALVLVAPPASGRAYLRELRAFQAMRSPITNGAPPLASNVEEAVGFVVTRDTAAELERIVVVGDIRPARRALLVARDDMPGPEPKLAGQLSSLDVSVRISRAPGYAAMMQEDPVKSVVPERAWSEIVRYLAEDGGESVSLPLPPERTVAIVRGPRNVEVVEEIVDVDGMFGILSRPAEVPRGGTPTILLNNVGANHHVGCNRLYVEFARRWAALGFATLRYDLVGIGDTSATEGRRENEVYSGACVADAARAMQWLAQTRGDGRFILGGICSGAYISFYAAASEPRVVGVMLMNPLTFHWREGDSLDVRMRATLKSTQFYRNAALELDTWVRAARGEVNLAAIARKLSGRAWSRVSRSAAQWLRSEVESDVASNFRKLCQRGTRVLLVCGEDDGSRDVVAEHLGPDARRMRRVSNFRLEVVPHTDHTFSPQSSQRDLADRLTSFLTRGRARVPRGSPRTFDSAPPQSGPMSTRFIDAPRAWLGDGPASSRGPVSR